MEDSVTLERLLAVCSEINFNLARLVEYFQHKDEVLDEARRAMIEAQEINLSSSVTSLPVLAELLRSKI